MSRPTMNETRIALAVDTIDNIDSRILGPKLNSWERWFIRSISKKLDLKSRVKVTITELQDSVIQRIRTKLDIR